MRGGRNTYWSEKSVLFGGMATYPVLENVFGRPPFPFGGITGVGGGGADACSRGLAR